MIADPQERCRKLCSSGWCSRHVHTFFHVSIVFLGCYGGDIDNHFNIMQPLQLLPRANVLGWLLGQTLWEAPAKKMVGIFDGDISWDDYDWYLRRPLKDAAPEAPPTAEIAQGTQRDGATEGKSQGGAQILEFFLCFFLSIFLICLYGGQ